MLVNNIHYIMNTCKWLLVGWKHWHVHWMKHLVKIPQGFSEQLTMCQVLIVIKGILPLQLNWMDYTSYWIFHLIMKRVFIIKADTNRLGKRLGLLKLFVQHLWSVKLNLVNTRASSSIQEIMMCQEELESMEAKYMRNFMCWVANAPCAEQYSMQTMKALDRKMKVVVAAQNSIWTMQTISKFKKCGLIVCFLEGW